jgi:hypothetical protein
MATKMSVKGIVVAALLAGFAPAVLAGGSLPEYPHARNMNQDMPAGLPVPKVLETADTVQSVDTWYSTNAPKSCTRTTASQGVKYACPTGSIMIYSHGGKTQIAFVPTMPGS